MLRRLWRSTSGLILLAGLAMVLATLVLGTVVYLTSHEALELQLDRRIAAETSALQAIAKDGAPALAEAIRQREDGHRTSEMGYMLLASDGRRLAGRLDAALPPPGWHELLPYRDPKAGRSGIAQALITPLAGGHTLVVAADRTPIDEIDSTIIWMFATTFGALLVIGVACAWILGTTLRRRLERISTTAEAIIDGDLSQRIALDGTQNEFDRLAETLNRMLARNQQLLENLQRVSTDIAHDLRTPLARQKQTLDQALAVEQSAQGYRDAIQTAADESEEILHIFAALLRISEIETFGVRDGFAPVDLSELVERVVDAFRAAAEQDDQQLFIADDEPGPVLGDRYLLAQLLANLIDNALSHTPAGTTVTVRLHRDADLVALGVEDNGPGIPGVDHDRVMQRFVRLDSSRSSPGHGLGMSLVAAIADAHHAKIELTDNRPGLRVTVRFAADRA